MKDKIFIIAGPTGSGKSDLALDLMRKRNGHIINADSLQVYSGLPILTAQPKNLENHFLYSVFEEQCCVALWREEALRQIKHSIEQGFLPIIVGGTGLYLKGLLFGLSPIPSIDNSVKNFVDDIPSKELFSFACNLDKNIKIRLSQNDLQRIKRALEVFLQTQKSIFEWQKTPGKPLEYKYEYHFIDIEREILYKRINTRFLHMIDNGAIQEVQNFCEKKCKPVTQAIGYLEIKNFLEGKISLEKTIDLAQTRTRQYAKRQLTWFKNFLK
jgi:tRNA dimethylallyltransferase